MAVNSFNAQNPPVTTKGDLFTFSTIPTRLGVGANGETLVADSSTTTGLRWQVPKTNNAIINGNFDIWQRGTSITSAQGKFSADRWFNTIVGTNQNCTITQDTSVPNINSKFSIKFTQVTSNATSVTEYAARQFIEQSNLLPFLGKTCVLSFWYRSNKTGTHAIQIAGAYNTGGTDQRTTFTVNAADTWEYKTIAITGLSTVTAASQGLTDIGTFIDIGFRVTNNGFTSISINDYFQLSQVQLEVGSVATPFARAGGTLAGELAACQRYFIRYENSTNFAPMGLGTYFSTTECFVPMALPVPMRTAPSVSWSGGATGATVYVAGNNRVSTATAYSGGRNNCIEVKITTAADTAGRSGMAYVNQSATMDISAEL